jgi:hypothetical protein
MRKLKTLVFEGVSAAVLVKTPLLIMDISSDYITVADNPR